MKSFPVLFALCACTVLAGDTPIPAPNSAADGRFRLFASDVTVGYDTDRGLGSVTVKMVWKIDTETGRTWHYWVQLNHDQVQECWIETTETLKSFGSTNRSNHESK